MNELVMNLLVSIVLTATVYMAFPLIRLAINHGKFEKKRANRIALWNSIIIGAFFCIVTTGLSNGGTAWNASPAVLYYFINRAILTQRADPEYSTSPAEPATSLVNKETEASPAPAVLHDCVDRAAKPETIRVSGSTPTLASKPILFCRKCGNKLAERSAFCNKCGTKVLTNGVKE